LTVKWGDQEQFELGDVVTLKSGGMPMTVIALPGKDHCPEAMTRVTWFEDMKQKVMIFPTVTLKRVKPWV
jgi:uncharacterized protein YodC (DUF2158 family)